ncbi:MAG TPA: N-acetyltransferase [Treponema sp.]|nr:MAG: hypothetical protein A2001_20265 [Treponema sp. GWC1_61_84]HCM26166.1 N-acetyltransferase [Treponema sp.]
MTVLAPMRPMAFESYITAAAAAYAEDNVAAGRWPIEGALERSCADLADSLPQGLATPDHYLFEILDGADGPAVGILWFGIVTRHGLRSAFVYDIEIKPEFRRRGHAKRAFEAMEKLVGALGLDSIGLHVFGHNPGAQDLYAKLGYRVTGINMAKKLGSGAVPAEPGAIGGTNP